MCVRTEGHHPGQISLTRAHAHGVPAPHLDGLVHDEARELLGLFLDEALLFLLLHQSQLICRSDHLQRARRK